MSLPVAKLPAAVVGTLMLPAVVVVVVAAKVTLTVAETVFCRHLPAWPVAAQAAAATLPMPSSHSSRHATSAPWTAVTATLVSGTCLHRLRQTVPHPRRPLAIATLGTREPTPHLPPLVVLPTPTFVLRQPPPWIAPVKVATRAMVVSTSTTAATVATAGRLISNSNIPSKAEIMMITRTNTNTNTNSSSHHSKATTVVRPSLLRASVVALPVASTVVHRRRLAGAVPVALLPDHLLPDTVAMVVAMVASKVALLPNSHPTVVSSHMVSPRTASSSNRAVGASRTSATKQCIMWKNDKCM